MITAPPWLLPAQQRRLGSVMQAQADDVNPPTGWTVRPGTGSPAGPLSADLPPSPQCGIVTVNRAASASLQQPYNGGRSADITCRV